jgi:glutamine synthetase
MTIDHVREMYGINTLTEKTLRELVPGDVYSTFRDVLRKGKRLDKETANAIAHAMKEWALSKGVTHYAHWFQPMTGLTAEKHDAFLSFEDDGEPIARFSGTQLIRSEPDASSFPSGGMRTTFEARGYTAWDPRSPAFILEGPKGKIFCIPSVFISYHGHALDLKTPLLRSVEALDKSAGRLLGMISSPHAGQRIKAMIGAEQEYFLLRSSVADLRLDLKLAGRTLIGAKSPKGQEMEDHYFGSIPPEVLEVMQEAEMELYSLGVPCKTRHNEVAPSQYEIAPIFEEASLAADHNQLIMEIIRKTAHRKGIKVLYHEKPFANLNGSGKHCNWSIVTEDGFNLMAPRTDRDSNLHFLLMLLTFVKGVRDHGGLLRASVSSASNDLRLGGNEAPPAIMSVFLGDTLSKVVESLANGIENIEVDEAIMDLGLSHLPSIVKDNTDRNRTSPMAFTGNKFEFRAVGSAESISFPVTILNGIMAESMEIVADMIQHFLDSGLGVREAIVNTLESLAKETSSVLFDGNCYEDSWREEAEKRGLPLLRSTPEAITFMGDSNRTDFLIRHGILTEAEINSRRHVALEKYIKVLEIESHILLTMAKGDVLPAAYRHQATAAGAIAATEAALGKQNSDMLSKQRESLVRVSEAVNRVLTEIEKLRACRQHLEHLETLEARAFYCHTDIIPAMESLRMPCDLIEEMVDRRSWGIPKYSELLFPF